MVLLITILISVFLAINMGSSGFSISFTPSYGCGIVKRREAVILYTIFVLVGALLIGSRVVDTLSTKLIKGFDSSFSGIIILISATITMFVVNILKIPQSTSFVLVGAFSGAGFFYGKTNFYKLFEIFFVAIIFSFAAFLLTYFIIKFFYPPGEKNFRLYEKIFSKQKTLRKFILLTDCYSSFAVGSNNVANVVAPVIIAGLNLPSMLLLAIFAPFFGLGGLVFGKGVIKTVSKDIIPLGEISAGIVSLVTSSFVIIASLLGLPTPYVQFTTFAVLAISAIKDGIGVTTKKDIVRRIIFAWLIVPFATGVISYMLHLILK